MAMKGQAEAGRSWRNNKIIWKWAASSVLLLVVPVLFGVVIYSHALKNVRQDIDYVQKQTLSQVRESMENLFYTCGQIAFSLTRLNEAEQLKNFREGEYTPEQILGSRTLLDYMNLYIVSNEMISDIVIYFPQTEHVLKMGKFCRLEWMRDREETELGMPVSEVQRLAEQKKHGVYRCSGGLVYSYANADYSSQNEALMLVLVYLNMNQVKRVVEMSDSMVFLLLPEGGYYSTEGGTLDPRWEEIGKNQEEGQEEDVVGRVPGSGEFVLSQMGETGGIRYLNVIGKKEYLKKTNQMTMVLVIYVVACLVFGGGSAWYISRRNYQPVADLVDLLPGQYQKETADNDFQKIRKAYQELAKEKSWAAERLRDARLTGINTWVNEMLKGRSQEFYSISGREAPWAKELTKECFAVISGELLEMGRIAEEQEAGEDTVEMAYFIVKNVLQEFLGASYDSVEGTTEGILFSIVNLDEKYDQDLVIQELKKDCQKTRDYIREQFGIRVSFSVSGIRRERDGIRQCYQDLEEVWEFRAYQELPEEETVCYTEFRLEDLDRFEEYNALCEKIQYLLKVRRIGDAEKLIKKLKAVKRPIPSYAALLQPGKALPGGEAAAEAVATEKFIAKEAIGRDSAKEVIGKESTAAEREIYLLMDQVAAYIDSHYTDSMLSASALADEFHIGLSYLSRAFKERTGVGVLNYINRKRIELAKRLLEREDMAVKDIAEQVGFFTTQPLIRLFRQMEGMTPKEYRNSVRGE